MLIEDYCQRISFLPINARSFAAELVNNSQGRPLVQLQVSCGMSAESRSLASLALHVYLTVLCGDESKLVRSLRLMLNEPNTLAVSNILIFIHVCIR